ncbi:hypothetical protein [Streptomyces acidiscabies]|uniref:Uncharacterized protein n=1 Tax=Streptomyces acidiscabies TaxID=42234 RepID=A0AAP6EK62_9ACTN|nr:hypothetical protein [Streptomyces acidiscabies]MBZ3913766.1 hypothetical protein [Streptomyces acidiscabies]MDX2965241.1 hypothetical protein [Streptomyces acidiscabies]MDX3022143.1 hypothetical protein [Streptomyces acidiscabies]MDX3795406.1 hypothetical protein [Streptomyces acidiscabies]GAQ51821.1 hypothetical protein a10_01601 [Streptomyces acidiscabies]
MTAHAGKPRIDPSALHEPTRSGEGPRLLDVAAGPFTRGPEHWDPERQVRPVSGTVVLVSGTAGLFLPGPHLTGTAVGAGPSVAVALRGPS